LIAQEAPAEFKTFEPKLKTDKDISEKRKEKDRARSVKTDKIDLAPIDAYYLEYILPRLTQQEPEVINSTRFDIFDDINTIEGNPSLLRPFNDRVIKWMTGLINRDAKGKTFSPATRINAAIILGRLHSSVPKSGSGTPVPDAAIHPILLSLIDAKEIDGLSSAALTSLARHLGRGAVKENVVKESDRKLFVAKLKEFIEAPKPVIRSAEAQKYLTGQAIDCLTYIAMLEPEKEPAKQATEILSPMLVKLFETEDSEWLLENACLSLGKITPVNLTPEDISKIEMGLVKYARRSLKEWKSRIFKSNGRHGRNGRRLWGRRRLGRWLRWRSTC
jgi:hypothetical protein